MNILIYGAGGVGGYLGAKFWKAGNPVVFIARGAHLIAMRRNGLLLESPEGSITVKAEFRETTEGLSPFDLIIICVKSFDTEVSATQCRSVINDRTTALTVQNGVENEEMIGRIVGHRHVIGGAAYIFSTIENPGVIRHRQGPTRFRIGELDREVNGEVNGESIGESIGESPGGYANKPPGKPLGEPGPRVAAVERAFRDAGITCELVPDLQRVLWEKFIFITGLSGMTAYSRQNVGRVLADPTLHNMLSQVVHETAEVARAAGIGRFEGIEERAEENFRKMPPESTSSMYYDVMHGKRVEVEALNGAVVRIGSRYGTQVPGNQLIYNALKPYSAITPAS